MPDFSDLSSCRDPSKPTFHRRAAMRAGIGPLATVVHGDSSGKSLSVERIRTDRTMVAQRVSHVLVDLAALGESVRASQDIAHPGRRGHQHKGRGEELRQRYEAGHRPAGLAQQWQSGVQSPRRRQHVACRSSRSRRRASSRTSADRKDQRMNPIAE